MAPARVLRVLRAGEEGGGAELRPGHHRTRVRLHLRAQAALAQVGVTGHWPLDWTRFVITEKAPTRAFSWLKAATTAFTFKTLC